MLTEFQFAQPWWLLGLLLPIVILWGFPPRHNPRLHKIHAYADAHLLPRLLLNTLRAKTFNWQAVTWIGLWVLGILALAGPRWDYEEQEVVRPQGALLVVLDLSESMLVKDLPHARLEQAIQEIEDILSSAADIEVGLLVFAGLPHLVSPLSDDYDTLRHLLYEITPDMLPIQGSRLSLALEQAKVMLTTRGNRIPHVLLLSDGDFTETDLIESLAVLTDEVLFLHVLGVGTVLGQQIELPDGSWRRDEAGNVVISRLQPEKLQQLAQAGKGEYQLADYQRQDVDSVLAAVRRSLVLDDAEGRMEKLWHERFYWLVGVMMVLLLGWFRRIRLAQQPA